METIVYRYIMTGVLNDEYDSKEPLNISVGNFVMHSDELYEIRNIEKVFNMDRDRVCFIVNTVHPVRTEVEGIIDLMDLL